MPKWTLIFSHSALLDRIFHLFCFCAALKSGGTPQFARRFFVCSHGRGMRRPILRDKTAGDCGKNQSKSPEKRVCAKKYRFGGRFWRPAYLKNPGDPDGSPGFFHALSIQNRWAVSLPRIILRGISPRETGQAAGPPHRGGPCSHPANIICRGPARNRRPCRAG